MAVFAEIEVLNILNHEILGVPHFHDPNSKGTESFKRALQNAGFFSPVHTSEIPAG